MNRRNMLIGAGVLAAALSAPALAKRGRLAGQTVLVVGAGFAGVEAARELRRLGAKPLILESSRRIGGRAYTVDVAGVPIEVGATWLHGGADNPVRGMARAAGVPFRNLNAFNNGVAAGEARPDLRELFERTKANDKIEAAFQQAAEKLQREAAAGRPVSAADAWPAVAQAIGDPVTATLIRDLVEARFAADIGAVGLAGLAEDSHLAPVPHFLPTTEAIVLGGMQRIVEHRAKGLDVRLDHHVEKIAWTDQGVVALTNKGRFTARAAVVTLPVGVLKATPSFFEPALPASHAGALSRTDVGVLGKLALVFPQAAWPTDVEGWFHTDGEIAQMVVNLAGFGQGPALVGLGNGAASRTIEALDEREAARRFKRQLERLFGRSLPDPVGVKATKWLADPLARGSYGVSGLSARGDEGATLASLISPSLILAGESYTSHDPHSVHGAARSGRDAARALAAA